MLFGEPCVASFVNFSSTNDAKQDRDVRGNSHEPTANSSEPIGEGKISIYWYLLDEIVFAAVGIYLGCLISRAIGII